MFSIFLEGASVDERFGDTSLGVLAITPVASGAVMGNSGGRPRIGCCEEAPRMLCVPNVGATVDGSNNLDACSLCFEISPSFRRKLREAIASASRFACWEAATAL
jgi:hypothetical protein